MKIVCSNKELINGVNIVSKAVPQNTTMSILNCILIDGSEDCIKLTANDGDFGIETIIEGTIIEKGVIAIDAKTLSEMVRSLPDEDITIETDDNYEVKVIYGKSHLDIKGENGESFTLIPYIEKKEAIVMSQLSLKDVIRQTYFSIGIGDTNKIMSGINMIIDGDNFRVNSLDGHRISIRNIKLNNSYSSVNVIVPGKTLNEISKILNGGAEDKINLYFTDNHILFEFDKTRIVSRLIEGKYFDVNKMVNKDYETKITVNKKNFLDCLSRSMLFSKEGNKKPVVLDIKEDRMRIYVSSIRGGLDEEVPVEVSGRDIEIGFNPKFISEAVKVIDDETINIYLVNSKSPCYIKDDELSFTYVILPINM